MTGRGIFRDKTGRAKYAICIECCLFGWNWFVRMYSSSCAEQGGLSACVMVSVNNRSVMKKYLLGLAGLVFVPFITLFSGCGGKGVDPGFVPVVANNTPRFAYVVNSGDNTVSQYTVNASTGLLRANGYVLTGAAPKAIAFAPNGKFAYVVNSIVGSAFGSVFVYTINASTGALSKSGEVSTGNAPVAIAIDPSGKFAFVANSVSNDVSAYVIDQSTGALSNVGGLGTNTNAAAGGTPSAITVDHSGKYVYVTNNVTVGSVSAYKINLQTNGLDPIDSDSSISGVQNFLAGANPSSITIDPTGQFVYVTNNVSTVVGSTVIAYRIDAATGALKIEGTANSGGTGLSSVAVAPSGKIAYVANSSSNTVSVYSIFSGTGALTLQSAAATGTTPVSVSIDPSGQFAYVANQGTNDVSVYSIQPNGSLALLRTNTGRTAPASIAILRGSAPVTYTPNFAYATNFSSQNISAYSINSGSGELASLGDAVPAANGTAATGPNSFEVHPSGKFAFVVSSAANAILAYSINSAGVLTQIDSNSSTTGVQNFATDLTPQNLAIDPSGRYVYVANTNASNVSAYSINTTTGMLTEIDADAVTVGVQKIGTGASPFDIKIDPSGRFVYVTNFGATDVSSYSINSATGALTSLGLPVISGANPRGISIDPTGKFVYVTNQTPNTVSTFSIDKATGVLSVAVNVDTGTAPFSVSIDVEGKFAYVANRGSNDVSAYSINVSTGALTRIDADLVTAGVQNFATGGVGSRSISIDPSGKYAYVANETSNNITAFSINSSTGMLSKIVATNVDTGTTPYSITTTGSIQ